MSVITVEQNEHSPDSTAKLLPWLVIWYSLLNMNLEGSTTTEVTETQKLLVDSSPTFEETGDHLPIIDLYAFQEQLVMSHYEPTLSGAMIDRLQDLLSKVTNKIKNSTQVTTMFDQWNSLAMIDLARMEKYRSYSDLYSLLQQNWFTFSREFALGEIVTPMVYKFDSEGRINGLTNSYKDDLAERGENFTEYLRSQGKSVSRSMLESNQMFKLKRWIVSSPLNSIAIWSSPPGSFHEGYPNRNGYSFTFIFRKTTTSTEGFEAQMTQVRTWMSLSEHAAFQAKLGFTPHIEGYEHPSYAIIDNFIQLNPPAPEDLFDKKNVFSCIADSQKQAWSDSQVQNILQYLTDTNARWNEAKATLAVLEDENKFTEMSDFLYNLYAQEVIPSLLKTVPEVSNVDDPEWKAFLKSADYERLVKELDIAFAILAFQPLTKFVKETAVNKDELTKKGVWQKEKTETAELSIATSTCQQIEFSLKELLKITLLDKPSRDQIDWFNKYAGNFLSTDRLFSVMHCGAGTFINTRMIQALSAAQFNGVSTEGLLSMRTEMITKMSTLEKSDLFNELSFNYTRQVIKKPNGDSEVWYVPVSYLDEPGCYYSEELQAVVGPCGIKLADDIYYAYTEAQYLALQTSLAQTLSEKIDALEAPEEEKTKIKDYITLIENKIYKKSISISEDLAGSIYDTQAAVSRELYLVMQQLRNGWTTIAEKLEYIIEKYISNNNLSALLENEEIISQPAS